MPFLDFRLLHQAGAVALLALLHVAAPATPAALPAPSWQHSCTLLVDGATGQVLRRDGGADCARRFSPFSTFKLPLAAIGFDAGVLTDEHTPRWDYRSEFNGYERQRHATDPSSWQRESIVWYSQQLTRALGAARFAAYVARLGYGNRDVRGGPGKDQDGLSHAWLGSSLAISADEQAVFVRRLLQDGLPLTPRAQALARAITPAFAAADGWQVHGKTGSGWLRGPHRQLEHNRPLGWFVGWADKDGRRVVFARMAVGRLDQEEGLGLSLRSALLKDLPALLASPTAAGAAQPSDGNTPAPQQAAPASAAQAPGGCASDGWDEPAMPRRIHGNTWYVGTCGVSSILVTSAAGHVLLDGGTARGGALVAASIRRLGFRLEDVRYILTSHAHHDHVGGVASLQAASGATVVARGADASALEHGLGDRSDPQFLISEKFPPAARVRRVRDGEPLLLGPAPAGRQGSMVDVAFTAHATPGHTPGSTSWTWTSCDDAGHCLRMAYVDSLSAITDGSFRYGDEASHPGVLAAFRASLATVAALPCDVLLTPHPGASDLLERLNGNGRATLVDGQACQRYAAQATLRLDERLAKEATNEPARQR